MELSAVAKSLIDSGFPISDKCCDVMKKNPMKKYQRETGRKPIVATMACESKIRAQVWMKNGCNAFDAKKQVSTPMSFWTEQDVLEYIYRFNIPYASVYGDIVVDDTGKYRTTGVQRTGCMFCMFGVHREKEPNRFQMMKITHPKIYEYCMKPVEDGGLGLADVLDFIGVKH